MKNTTIRIKIKAYDQKALEKYVERVLKAVNTTGTTTVGPIPLPTKKKRWTTLRSPHVNKKARDQFERLIHTRFVDIKDPSNNTMQSLDKLEMPAGISIDVKV